MDELKGGFGFFAVYQHFGIGRGRDHIRAPLIERRRHGHALPADGCRVDVDVIGIKVGIARVVAIGVKCHQAQILEEFFLVFRRIVSRKTGALQHIGVHVSANAIVVERHREDLAVKADGIKQGWAEVITVEHASIEHGFSHREDMAWQRVLRHHRMPERHQIGSAAAGDDRRGQLVKESAPAQDLVIDFHIRVFFGESGD